MDLQHVNVKIFVDGPLPVDMERFLEVFHHWVAEQSFDEMLIDVADYRHVPAGPGVIMIGHEADYAIDHADNRPGLLYNRKAPMEGTNTDRFASAFRCAAAACRRLETEFSEEGLKFSRNEFQIVVNDRALAPNTPETMAACKPEIEGFLKNLLKHDEFTMEPPSDPRKRFGFTVKTAKPCEFDSLTSVATA